MATKVLPPAEFRSYHTKNAHFCQLKEQFVSKIDMTWIFSWWTSHLVHLDTTKTSSISKLKIKTKLPLHNKNKLSRVLSHCESSMLDFDVSEFSKFVSRLFMMVSSAEFEDVWGTVVDVGIMGLPIFKWQKSNKSDVHHQFSTFEPYLKWNIRVTKRFYLNCASF